MLKFYKPKTYEQRKAFGIMNRNIHKKKMQNEIKKRNKRYWKINSILILYKINGVICILGGINYGKSHSENWEYNNWKF